MAGQFLARRILARRPWSGGTTATNQPIFSSPPEHRSLIAHRPLQKTKTPRKTGASLDL